MLVLILVALIALILSYFFAKDVITTLFSLAKHILKAFTTAIIFIIFITVEAAKKVAGLIEKSEQEKRTIEVRCPCSNIFYIKTKEDEWNGKCPSCKRDLKINTSADAEEVCKL